jgi:hypothetical protein
MTLPHLPGKLAKIRRKVCSQFQIVGILDHAKNPVITGFQANELKIYRSHVLPITDGSK